MSSIDASQLLNLRSTILSQNTALQKAAGGIAANPATPPVNGAVSSFGGALQAVNEQQSRAGALSEAYDRGQTHDLVAVMVERQKASIGFEATLQVRNKLLSAYRDIMNMPV